MKLTKMVLAAAATMAFAQAQALTVTVTAYDGSDASAHTQTAGAIENTFDPVTVIGTYSDLTQLTTGSPMHAAQPAGSIGNYLSVGPAGPHPLSETVTFSSGASYFGFLWGSPDDYNTFTITTNLTTQSYTGTLIIDPANGNRAISGFANFTAGAGEVIQSVRFESATMNAFETDNHAAIAAVPEPETWALLLAGLVAVGFMARRNRAD